MSVFTHRPALRWAVPIGAAVLLGAGGSAVGVVTATARGGLPDRSAAALLVDVQKARLDGLSGTIVQNADLGLPSLPGVGGSGSSDLTSLVAGSHTLRLWYAGPDRVRLALLGSLGESDVIRSGTSLWTWSSKDKSATHRTVPLSSRAAGDGPTSLAQAAPVSPQQAAEIALAAITPSTRVSTDGTAVVAGRSAYELLLEPRDTTSLVGSVRIAIDGKTHVPTRVQVFAKGSGSPAFEVGFTSFDPSTPDASVFRFNPPPGTKVTESPARTGRALPSPSGAGKRATPGGGRTPGAGLPSVTGSGWGSMVVTQLPAGVTGTTAGTGGTTGRGAGSLAGVLRVLPRVSGSWGSGHLLAGRLFSAVLTDDGRLAVGAVAPPALYQALGRG